MAGRENVGYVWLHVDALPSGLAGHTQRIRTFDARPDFSFTSPAVLPC